MTPTLPPGACDAHCHVFGPADLFPFDPARTYTPDDAPAEALYALHRRLGLERAVLIQPGAHGYDNRALLAAIAGANGRYRGIALLPFDVSDSEMQDLSRRGIRGVRYNFMPHLGPPPPLDAFRTMMARLAGIGWHVVIHVGGADLATLRPYLDRLPVPAVIDHLGRIDAGAGRDQAPFATLLEYAREPDIWVKISGADRASATGAPWQDVIPFARDLISVAPDRILWGTDWPHPNIKGDVPDDAALVRLLHEIVAEPDLLRAVLVDNPARLYRFDERD